MSTSIRPLMFGKLLPPPYAGVEAHVDQLLRALQPQVQGTLLACSVPASAAAKQQALPYRSVVHRFHGRMASAPIAPGMLWAVRGELASGRCNLLHLHAPNPLGDLAALLFAADVPVVLSWHSDIVRQRLLRTFYAPVQRRVIDRADNIVVVTPGHFTGSQQLQRRGVERKLRVIPIGFDLARLQPALADTAMTERLHRFAGSRPLVLTVGRHIYYKGYEYLIEAVARLRSDAVLAMVGTGPLGQQLRQRAAERGVADRVLFLGEVGPAELIAAYHRCDVFALPSVEPSEAFGMASAEAMACGKPTVVCELGNGVNYLNQAGRTSLSVPPRDVPALADALDQLAIDGALRGQLGARAREWIVSTFSVEATRDAHIALYRELLG
jgi:glycosyltransferase involved in cell wall biosynthesis